jgi:ABC-2 type transport system permease protein
MINQTLLVAKQVYRTKVKTVGFWAMVLSPLILPVVGFIIGFALANTSGDEKTTLAIVSEPALAQTLKSGKFLDVDKITTVSSIETAKKQLKSKKIDGFLTQSAGKYVLTTLSETAIHFDENTVRTALTQIDMLNKAQKLNLTAEDIANLQMPADLAMKTQSKTGDDAEGGDVKNSANYVISVATGVIIFVLLSLYVGMISHEIANEKSNRIMETLLAATGSNVQYYGKILGVIALMLTQLGLYIVLVFGAKIFLKGNSLLKMASEAVSGVDTNFFISALLFLLFGIVGYLVLTAIVASLINEQSQVQQAVTPITYIAMIGYILSFMLSTLPNSLFIKIMSFIPFISPTLMPGRFAIEYANSTEVWLAIVLQIVAVVLLLKFGEKIYAKNVLSYSDEKIIKQLIANLRNK